MLVLSIFSLMMAVALPNVQLSPILLTRVTSLVLLYTAALSYNALDLQGIGEGGEGNLSLIPILFKNSDR